MKIGTHDIDREVFIVAEIGNNHEGSYTLAEELIGHAVTAGAHAVKFQTFRTEHYVSEKDEARFSRLKSFELSFEEFARLQKAAEQAGVLFISTPFDLESARFLEPLVPVFKISSGDNTFYPLLDFSANTGKALIISTGLATLAQLQHTKARIEHLWAEKNICQELAFMHCVSSYPVPPKQANLNAIKTLQSELRCTVGYSDHTLGIEAAVMAVGLGARIIEKHFTLDKTYSDFRDHQLSADPQELRELVDRVKTVEEMLGTGEKVPQECEREGLGTGRRSIIAERDLPEGTILRWEDITWVRPGGGIPPGNEYVILGRQLNQPVKKGEQLLPQMFIKPDLMP